MGILDSIGNSIACFEVPEPLTRSAGSSNDPPLARPILRGTLREVKAEAKVQSALRKKAKQFAIANTAAAESIVQASLAASSVAVPTSLVQEDIATATSAPSFPLLDAVFIPGWARSVHGTHPTLYFTGGITFCYRCGSVATSAKRGRLQQPCTRVLAPGSSRRRELLLQGDINGIGAADLACWPDGTSRSLRMKVFLLRSVSVL